MTHQLHDVPAQTFENKKVLVRVDFNVPLTLLENGDKTVASNHRIVECLPTIRYLVDAGATVLLLAHFGRPKGQVNLDFSLAPVAKELASLLPQDNVVFLPETKPDALRLTVNALPAKSVALLENTRFNPGEEANDPAYAEFLASLGDVYVNDAFGASHRAHASTEGITKFAKHCYAGLLMAKELGYLKLVLENPQRPLTAIIGGSKVSTKIAVLENLLNTVDTLIIGGGMVFTFLKARGLEVGKSLCEDDFVETARDIEAKAARLGKQILLPTDIVVAPEFGPGQVTTTIPSTAIPVDQLGLDIGQASIDAINACLNNSKTVLWNGPLGVFEIPEFAHGTASVAKHLAALTGNGKATTILGGGDTQAAIHVVGLQNSDFSHVSTGGGASLEFLEGKVLPGVQALETASLSRV